MWLVRFSAVLALSSTLFGASDDRSATAPSPIRVEAHTTAWADQVEWGIARFEAARLELPAPLRVEVHADDAPCHGNSGRYAPGDAPVVHLCAAVEPGSRIARLITLHELAHAWAETQLDPDTRDSFLELRGLDAWIDADAEPFRWGAEHAAEVVSWGLMDEQMRIIRIDGADPVQLTVAFDALTHRAPLWQEAGPTNVEPS